MLKMFNSFYKHFISQVSGAPSPMKKIPDDANKRHPVQLLNQLRPGCQYRETREGNVPSLTFTIYVTIDGVEYSGVGKFVNAAFVMIKKFGDMEIDHIRCNLNSCF